MNRIEDLVRESLRERAEVLPVLDDPAGRAMRGAARVRRHRTVVAVCCAGLAVLVGAAGLSTLRGETHTPPTPPATARPTGPAPTVSSAPAVSSARVDLIIDHRTLALPSGRSVTLPGTNDGGIVAAVRVHQGWLVTGTTGSDSLSLWFVPLNPLYPRRLALGLVGPPVFAPGGQKLAWATGSELFVGHLTDDGNLVVDTTSPMLGGGGFPIAMTGGAVVLGGTQTGGGIDRFDLWVPSRGHYVPSWAAIQDVAGIYGAAPDGRLVLGLVYRADGTGSKQTCLAELDPMQSLRAVRTACGPRLFSETAGAVSPDGHWFAARAEDLSIALIDLSTVFQKPAVTRTWHADRLGVWVDPHTLVMAVDGQLRGFDTDDGTSRALDIQLASRPTALDLVPVA